MLIVSYPPVKFIQKSKPFRISRPLSGILESGERGAAMKKWVPIEKRSKKERRRIARKKRATWGALNPVTRRLENPRAYRRKKFRKGEDDF
jgi:hypothetical protein